MASKKLKFKYQSDNLGIKLLYQDEGRFGRINNLTKCWVPKGMRAVVGKQIIRQYTYAYTAVCPETGENFSLILPYSNTICMDIFLKKLSKRFIKNRIILALDQAAWHTTNNLNLPRNIIIWELPPRSPELNPTEHIWEYIREQKKFNNHTFNTLNELEEKLAVVLEEMTHEKKIVKSMTYFNWMKLHS